MKGSRKKIKNGIKDLLFLCLMDNREINVITEYLLPENLTIIKLEKLNN